MRQHDRRPGRFVVKVRVDRGPFMDMTALADKFSCFCVQRLAAAMGWQFEILSQSISQSGGLKEASASVKVVTKSCSILKAYSN